MRTILLKIGIACWAWMCFGSAASAIPTPEDELAGIFKLLLAKNASTEWTAVQRIPGSKWAPLPPAELKNCLPDGGCYARQGTLALGGRNLVLIATGARTIVSHIYLRNTSAAFGENTVLASLQKAGLSAELARCPVSGTPGDTNWYRVKAVATQPGFLSVQRSCGGKPFGVVWHGFARAAAKPAANVFGRMRCRGRRAQTSFLRDAARIARAGAGRDAAADEWRRDLRLGDACEIVARCEMESALPR